MRRASVTILAIGLFIVGCTAASNAESPAASAGVRTITVTMTDAFRFDPASIAVRAGETVRFEVMNAGEIIHEFLIGDAEDQAMFEDQMGDGNGIAHDGDAGVSVEPGQTETFEYTFDTAGELLAGCHEPGHYDAGMVATIIVES